MARPLQKKYPSPGIDPAVWELAEKFVTDAIRTNVLEAKGVDPNIFTNELAEAVQHTIELFFSDDERGPADE